MAYVGTPIDTRNQFQSLQGKRFNGDGSTTDFTLDVAPGSTLDIEVFVGNVRQAPNSAYTLSGTTLSFTGAPPSGTNNIYVVHQAKSVGTINAPDNSIDSAQLNTAFLTGATDIGAGIADADLFLVDDGASGTLRKVAASRLSTYISPTSATDSFTINGSTPTLTIGDAGAEDTKIVFDGNAQDFHIGLDDSADDLLIGLGSTLGTTTHMAFDEAGHITKPLQSCSLARIGTNESINFSSMTDLKFDTEIFDQNADFNTSNYTFTAPVTGRYLVNAMTGLSGYGNAAELNFRIDASNRDFDIRRFGMNGGGSGGNVTIMTGSVLVDMDASDTVKLRLEVASGTSVEVYPERSCFSVLLVA